MPEKTLRVDVPDARTITAIRTAPAKTGGWTFIYAPGAGKALAEWIVAGAPQQDLVEVSPSRVAGFQANPRYLFERTRESLGRLYGMHWPYWQPSTARGVRRTPLYERLAAANAAFGEAAGWERAAWFAPEGEEPSYRYAFGRQNWFESVREECLAARERVALFDLSTYSKFSVAGPGALGALQWTKNWLESERK